VADDVPAVRAAVAFALAVWFVFGAAAPHVHLRDQGGVECAVCVTRHGVVAQRETPDLTPRALHAEPALPEPGLAPVFGAPLGAIPGQSPPAAA
jgi:hypothetical protein